MAGCWGINNCDWVTVVEMSGCTISHNLRPLAPREAEFRDQYNGRNSVLKPFEVAS